MLIQLYTEEFFFFPPPVLCLVSHFPAVSSVFRLRGQAHLLLRRIRHSASDAKSCGASARQLVFHQVSLIRHCYPPQPARPSLFALPLAMSGYFVVQQRLYHSLDNNSPSKDTTTRRRPTNSLLQSHSVSLRLA